MQLHIFFFPQDTVNKTEWTVGKTKSKNTNRVEEPQKIQFNIPLKKLTQKKINLQSHRPSQKNEIKALSIESY